MLNIGGQNIKPISAFVDNNAYADITQDSQIAQLNGRGHWFSCEDSQSSRPYDDDGNTEWTSQIDVLNGAIFDKSSAAIFTCLEGDDPGKNIRLYRSGGFPITGEIINPGNSDLVVIVCGKSRTDPAKTPDGNGSIEVHFAGSVACQPYYFRYKNKRTKPYIPNWVRTGGDTYIHASIRRGNTLEHYVEDRMTDQCNMHPDDVGVLLTNVNNFSCGHSGYGAPISDYSRTEDINFWSNTVDYAQDFYGILYLVYPNGAPSYDIIRKSLAWMKNDWVNTPQGEKRIYPGLIL